MKKNKGVKDGKVLTIAPGGEQEAEDGVFILNPNHDHGLEAEDVSLLQLCAYVRLCACLYVCVCCRIFVCVVGVW